MRALKIAFTFVLFAIAVIAATSCGSTSSHSNPSARSRLSHDLGGEPAHGKVFRRVLMHRYRYR
jgi:hypothetical protein